MTKRTCLLFLLSVSLVTSCVGPRKTVVRPGRIDGRPRVWAVLINGGAQKEKNYLSHMTHIRRLAKLLRHSGVGSDAITIFAGDGEDPGLDLATARPGSCPDCWLVSGTKLGRLLAPSIRYQNSTVEGVAMLPAKLAALETWFHLRRHDLAPGDTLLLFVTDHGRRLAKKGGRQADSTISLWREQLPAQKLLDLLGELDPGVRVVMWMSQCYSGEFARAVFNDSDRQTARENICGFYSTLPTRKAWGCYPEALSDAEGKGHSMRFLDALAPGLSLGDRHDLVVVSDRTPNVPHRSSDYFLSELIKTEMGEKKTTLNKLVDELLEQAWKDPKRWEKQAATLDRLAARLGAKPPRYLRQMYSIEKDLRTHINRANTFRKLWSQTLVGLKTSLLNRFIEERPEWKARNLAELKRNHKLSKSGDKTDEEIRIQLIDKLLGEFKSFVASEVQAEKRLQVLLRKKAAASAISARNDVRDGLLLRMRTVLTAMAGEQLASGQFGPAESLKKIRECEAWSLPGSSADEGAGRHADQSIETFKVETLSSLSGDLVALEQLRPAWLGVRYGQENEEFREKHKLPQGAVAVHMVIPESPAKAAGLEWGDTVVGFPGAPFKEPGAIRERVMLSKPGEAVEFEIFRDGARQTLKAELVPYPDDAAKLGASLKVGQKAYPLKELRSFRGEIPPAGKPVLLFFFATWCGPCKSSVPELLEIEKERGIPVLAVTKESPEKLKEFLEKRSEPFPQHIASDPRGLVNGAYRVTSFPNYFLIGKDGTIQGLQRGYRAGKGFGQLFGE